jgi:hypothetical protein
MGNRALCINLALLAVSYVVMDVGLVRARALWTLGLCGLAALWFALAGALIGGALWGVERAFARARGKSRPGTPSRPPGLAEFRLYAGLGADTVFAFLVLRLYAYALG